MIADSIAGALAVVAFGGGTLAGGAFGRRKRPVETATEPDGVAPPVTADRRSADASVRDAITAYGEQLGTIDLAPSSPETDEVAIGHFRRALDCYSRASEASAVVDLTTSAGREFALAELARGRAALAALAGRRREAVELLAAVERFETELAEVSEGADVDADAVELAHRAVAAQVAEQVREVVRSSASDRGGQVEAALARGRAALAALAGRRRETVELLAAVEGFETELAEVSEGADLDAVESAHRAVVTGVAEQARAIVRSTASDRGSRVGAALRRGGEALDAWSRRRAETERLAARVAALRAELEALSAAAGADATEAAHLATGRAALGRCVELLGSAQPERRQKVDDSVQVIRTALADVERRRTETAALAALIAAYTAETARAAAPAADADDAERDHHAAVLSALERATGAAASSGGDRADRVGEALAQGRAQLRLLSRRQEEGPGLHRLVRQFREQLEGVASAPEQTEQTERAEPAGPAVGEYREAQDALAVAATELAGATEQRAGLVREAVGRGRAALIRFEAVRSGRPVPLELVSRDELRGTRTERFRNITDERFLYRGRGRGEFLLDPPEAGAPALLDVTFRGEGPFKLEHVRRTAAGSARRARVDIWRGAYQGTQLVGPDVTHLAVDCAGEDEWSVRVLPLTQARPLTTTARGRGPEVLRCEQTGHGLLTVQLLRSGHGSVQFVEDRILRRTGWGLDLLVGDLLFTTTNSEHREEKWVYGSGLLLVEADGHWALDLSPRTPPINDFALPPVAPELERTLLDILAEGTEDARARAVAELRRVTGAGPSISRAYVADLARHR
ncbi:hypothetical protein ABH931_000641 [Streptacidiphilus sp. MAP12-33]|uniref:hypothetical protein n=1 Tax=Streptacidiphilus sp. MAP12-33 TaxID=3156266 RepID=UPI0035167124